MPRTANTSDQQCREQPNLIILIEVCTFARLALACWSPWFPSDRRWLTAPLLMDPLRMGCSISIFFVRHHLGAKEILISPTVASLSPLSRNHCLGFMLSTASYATTRCDTSIILYSVLCPWVSCSQACPQACPRDNHGRLYSY